MVQVSRKLWAVVVPATGVLAGAMLVGCEKQASVDEGLNGKRLRVENVEGLLRPPGNPKPGPVPRPDTLRPFPGPEFIKLTRPLVPLSLSRCINSYDDFVDALGSNKFQADAVILDDGAGGEVRLERSANLPGIWYTAVPEVTGSSLFRSQLMVEWRPDPSVYFMGFTADVWSVGCVYESLATGPFTNILKGGVEILINTCFFWGAPPYQHLRVKYLVIN